MSKSVSDLGLCLERTEIIVPTGAQPILLVVVDTEEEFDWHADFDRSSTRVEAMQEIHRAQEVFDEFGVRPVYVVDYPILSSESATEPLREYAEDHRAEMGAHLHPWVTPPHEEQVCRHNSFAGNLPPELEREKLLRLGDVFQQVFCEPPRIYKAGRYGLGPQTASTLEELEYEIELSACPPFDFRDEGGPDYSSFSCHSYWFGRSRRLLGVPSTAAYIGYLSRLGGTLYQWSLRPPWSTLHLPGILARSGALSRLRLSPEGFTTEELCRLTTDLYRDGVRIFAFSFHSPSVRPGCTPYVSSISDRNRFLEKFRGYFDFFLSRLGGRCMTASELRRFLMTTTEASLP